MYPQRYMHPRLGTLEGVGGPVEGTALYFCDSLFYLLLVTQLVANRSLEFASCRGG